MLDARPDGLVVGPGFTDADLFALLDAIADDPRLERLPVILRLEQAPVRRRRGSPPRATSRRCCRVSRPPTRRSRPRQR